MGLLLFLLELLLERVLPSVLELLWGLGLLFQQGAAEQEQVALQERGQVLELELLQVQVPELEQGQVLAEQLGQEQLQELGLAEQEQELEQLQGRLLGQVEQLGRGLGLVMGPWPGQELGRCR